MWNKLRKIGKEKNFLALLSNGSVAFLGLVSFMLLTRQLEKQLFGEWVLFITLSTFIDLLRFGLTRTSSVRLLSGGDDQEQKQILGSAFRINLVLLAGISLLCWTLWGTVSLMEWEINNGYLLFLIWYPLFGPVQPKPGTML